MAMPAFFSPHQLDRRRLPTFPRRAPGASILPGRPPAPTLVAFPLTQPLLGTFGNSGRDQLRLDGLSNVDMGIYKNTRVSEKVTVQFRWETYNLFNHPNFSASLIR